MGCMEMRNETIMHLIQQLGMYKRPKWKHSIDENDMLDGYEEVMKGITSEEVKELVVYLRDIVFTNVGYSFFPDPAQMKMYWDEINNNKIKDKQREEFNEKQKQKEAEERKNKLSLSKVEKAHEKARDYLNGLTEAQKEIAKNVLVDWYSEKIVDMPNELDQRPREVRILGIRKQCKRMDLSTMLGSFITSGRGVEIKQEIESRF